MAPWLMLAGVCALAGLVAANPVLWRRSPDGKRLWRRAVLTQREDLRMGAAFLLMAAITLAFIGTVTFDSHDPPSSARPAASTAKENSDDDAALNLASGEAVFLITVAAGALARSCSKRSGHRLVTYR